MLKHLRFLAVPVVVGLLFSLASTAAHAQRPALTKSVDEPGRAPYHQYIQGTCVIGTCRFTFKAVPVGFRLVVTHVSLLSVSSSSLLAYLADDPTFVGIAAPDGSSNAIVLGEAPRVAGSPFTTVNAPVTFYVDAGKSPFIVLAGTGTPTASINGYLVALD